MLNVLNEIFNVCSFILVNFFKLYSFWDNFINIMNNC